MAKIKSPLFNFWYRRQMKWPKYLIMVRHDVSAYNLMKIERAKTPIYQKFVAAFKENPTSKECELLARQVNEKFALQISDPNTPLAQVNSERIVNTGKNLRLTEELPDVIFVSPYLRTKQTLEALMVGWPELRGVKVYEEERIREQSHGLASLFNDWQVFYTLYPEQKVLHDQEGDYWFQWPQGERVPDVRDRVRSWTSTLIRDFSNKKVLTVSHHLTKLALRANLERLDDKEFQRINEEEKPINCGATKYVGVPNIGKNGRFVLEYYNKDLSMLIK